MDVTPEDRRDRLVRYALIAVAGLSALLLSLLALRWSGSLSGLDSNVVPFLFFMALMAIAMAAGGAALIGRHPWGAVLIAWAALLMAPLLAFGILGAIGSSILPSPYDTSHGGIDPEDVGIALAFLASLVTGRLAIRLDRSLRGLGPQ